MLSEIEILIDKKSFWNTVVKINIIFKKHPGHMEKLFGLELSLPLNSEEQDSLQEFNKLIDKGHNGIIEFATDTTYNEIREDSKYE